MNKNDSFTNNIEDLGIFLNNHLEGTKNLQIILETIPSAIVLVNADGNFTYINKRGMELYGINYSGFNMKAHIEKVKALRLDATPFPLEEMPVSHSLKSGQVVRNVEMIIQNVSGIKYPVNVSSAPMHDANGKINGAIVVFEDFTERKQNEKELLEAKEKLIQKAEDNYRMLFNAIDQGFFVIDILFDENDKPIDMYYVEANDAATKILGTDYTGRRLREIDPNYEKYWVKIFGKVALTGQSIRMEQYAEPDKKWYSFYIFRIGDEKSRRIGNIFLDITARRQAEKELIEAKERLAQNAEEKYRLLFENMNEGFSLNKVIYNSEGNPCDFRYIEVNKAYKITTGLKAVDIIGKTLLEIAPDIEQTWIEMFSDAAVTGKPAKLEDYNQSTNRYYDNYTFSPKKGYIACLIRDITDRKKMEEIMKSQKNILETVIENIPDPFAIYNKDSCLVQMNAACRKLYPTKDTIKYVDSAHKEYEYFDLDGNRILAENLPSSRVLRGETVRNAIIVIKRGDKKRITEVNAVPIFDKDNQLSLFLTFHRNITEQKKLELAMQNKVIELQTVLDAVPAAVWIAHDVDCLKITGNLPSYEMLKLPPSANASKSAPQGEAPDTFEMFKDGIRMLPEDMPIQRAARGEVLHNFEFDFVYMDGSIRHMIGNAVPLLDEEGTPAGSVAAFMDITNHKNIEEALKISEIQFRTLCENSPDSISRLDTDLRHLYVNPVAQKISGMDITGKTWREAGFHEDFFFFWEAQVSKAIETGRMETVEDIYQTAQEQKFLTSRIAPEFDETGKVISALIITTEITDRKKAEEALRKSEEQFVIMFEKAPYGIALVSLSDGAITNVNHAWEHIFGYSRQEAIGKTTLELGVNPSLDMRNRVFAALQENGFVRDVETVFSTKSGERITVSINSDVIEIAGRKYILSSLQDITERKKMEEELKSQKHLLESVIENMSDALFVIDNEGVYRKINKAGKELFHSIVINKFGDVYSASKFYDLAGNEVKKEDLPYSYIRQGIHLNNQQFMHKYGTETNYISFSGAPLFDEAGKFILGIICARDITDAVKNQILIRGQQAKTLQAEKEKNDALKKAIEMKDEFLSLISHEFKTPLTVINSAIQAMEFICKNELSDKARGFLNKIRQNSNRQLKLVNNLLDVTRANAGHLKINKTNIDIVRLTRSITESINTFAIQKSIKLSFTSTLSKKIMGIDEEKYERILLNLLSNAIKFTPGGKSITLKISQKLVKGEYKLCIQVRDQGVGIPDDKKELIFERFGQVDSSFTRQAEGTGIGLSLVKMLVELHDGEIVLESKVDAGSTFTILLPTAKVIEISNEQTMIEISDNRLIQATAIEFSDV